MNSGGEFNSYSLMLFVDLRSSLFVFVLGLAALGWSQEAHQHAPSTNPYHLRLAAAKANFTSLHPANTESASSLATVDSKGSRLDEAIRAMQSLVAQHPNDASLHEWLAYLYGSSGHKIQYEKELAKAAELSARSDALRGQFPGPPAPANDPDRKHLANVAGTLHELRTNPPSDSSNVTSLANITVERVSPNGQSSQRNQLLLLMNTDAGASDYSTYRIQYSYALQKLDLISARIHKPDGRTVLAESDGETGYSDAAISMYYDTRQRVLRFPHLSKGDVLELSTESPRKRTLTRTAATTAGSSRFNHHCRKSFAVMF